jgi:FAD/FMN-containing dehydrogenase
MHRFNDVTYDSASQTVVVGAGLVWDDVYAALEPHGVNVVGGRVSGIGVAGFTLGGGETPLFQVQTILKMCSLWQDTPGKLISMV